MCHYITYKLDILNDTHCHDMQQFSHFICHFYIICNNNLKLKLKLYQLVKANLYHVKLNSVKNELLLAHTLLSITENRSNHSQDYQGHHVS